jgi:hypothetical protein
MNVKKNIIYLFLIIFFFVAGFFTSHFFYKPCQVNTANNTVDNNTYQTGWIAAKNRLMKLGIIETNFDNIPVNSVTGKIKNINTNTLSVKIVPFDPFSDPTLDERAVKVTNNTQIYQYTKKSEQDFQKEVESYNEKIKRSKILDGNGIMEPSAYEKVKAVLADFKIGQNLVIKSKIDIKIAKEFNADEIIIQN